MNVQPIRRFPTIPVVSVLLMLSSFIYAIKIQLEVKNTISNIKPTIITKIEYYLPDETHKYLRALRLCESQGRYKVNAYQIRNIAMSEIGYEILSTKSGRELFQKDSVLQEEVMLRLLQSQIRIMYPYLKKYNNTNIGNYWISNSGILAMAHLCGPSATIVFLTKGTISVDGNKVPITRYLQFNNFNIPIDSVLLPNYINEHLLKYLRR